MHRCLLVALHTAGRDRDTVEGTVAKEMAPFGGPPEHGGLWDSWKIGGRWTGHLSGYDPFRDQRNYSPCNHCGGTGTQELTETDTFVRRHGREAWYKAYSHGHESGLFPVIGKGCNACMGTGLMQNSSLVPHHGDIIRRDEIDLDALLRRQRADAVELHRGLRRDPTLRRRAERERILAMTEAEYVETVPAFPPFAALLRHRHWIEQYPLDLDEDLATKCKRARQWTSAAPEMRGIAATTVTTLYEDADDWDRQFYRRFVEPLPRSTLLVVVDLHW